MVTLDTFARTIGLILAAMMVLAVFETVWPFFRSDWRRRHLVPNLGLMALTLMLNFAFNAGAVAVASVTGPHGPHLLAAKALPTFALGLIGIVILDASTYACHRLMHALPPLWRAHSVHHSDPLVDITSALRFHPIETLWRFPFRVNSIAMKPPQKI